MLSYQAVEVIAAALEESGSSEPAEACATRIAGPRARGPAAGLRRPDHLRRDRSERERDGHRDAGPEGRGRAGLPEPVRDLHLVFPASPADPDRSPEPMSQPTSQPASQAPDEPIGAEAAATRRRPRPPWPSACGRRPAARPRGRRPPRARAGLHGRGSRLRPDHPVDRHRAPARRRLRAGLDRPDADLRRARGGQLRPGLDAHAVDVPGLRDGDLDGHPGLRRHRHLDPGDVRLRCRRADAVPQQAHHGRQPRGAAADHPRGVAADHQRTADGLRRPAQVGARQRRGLDHDLRRHRLLRAPHRVRRRRGRGRAS